MIISFDLIEFFIISIPIVTATAAIVGNGVPFSENNHVEVSTLSVIFFILIVFQMIFYTFKLFDIIKIL